MIPARNDDACRALNDMAPLHNELNLQIIAPSSPGLLPSAIGPVDRPVFPFSRASGVPVCASKRRMRIVRGATATFVDALTRADVLILGPALITRVGWERS
jgi:hypothetical protein